MNIINFKKAKDLLLQSVSKTGAETISLGDADSRIASGDILAPISHPIFDQSAVDGYAFSFGSVTRVADNDNDNDNDNDDDDDNEKVKLFLNGEVKAGDEAGQQINTGEAIRIFTGGKMPEGLDTVEMQEHVTLEGEHITLEREIKEGQNVRKEAEQIVGGELAVKRGTLVNPATIGFLASLGIREIPVSKTPAVQIIVTGNEFANEEEGLRSGKIFESNGEMLVAALSKMSIKSSFEECTDKLDLLTTKIKAASDVSDVLILSGGVSVGDYDFTKPALEANGYEVIFHNVKQKPGKPMLFMKKGQKSAFGLPGNPRAVMICFWVYVLPLLNAMMGKSTPELVHATFSSASTYKKKDDDKIHFLAGKIQGGEVILLETQGSHMMKSLAEADCLVENPADVLEIKVGDPVKVAILP